MTDQTIPRPTRSELEILRVLWTRGPSTVREVQKELNRKRPMGYTTALKFLQIMIEKGLVERDRSAMAHVYRPRLPRETTQKQLIHDLFEQAFEGSAAELVIQALGTMKTTPQDLAEIRRLLDELEGESHE